MKTATEVSFEIGYTEEGDVIIVLQPQDIQIALPVKATKKLITSLIDATKLAQAITASNDGPTH